jgi:hypothetical protein
MHNEREESPYIPNRKNSLNKNMNGNKQVANSINLSNEGFSSFANKD